MAKQVHQPAALFAGIPDVVGTSTGVTFGRAIDVQEGIPLYGSRSDLRTYSPFVIRVVLPSIIGGDQSTLLQTQLAPERQPPAPEAPTVRSSNRAVTYSQAMQGPRVDPTGIGAYQRLVRSGEALPGLSEASEGSLEDAYNQALFQQQFSEQQRNVSTAPASTRNGGETPALTNDTTALSLALQIKRLSKIPPLLMLVNPSSMKVAYAKIAQFQNRNRYGYVYEAWGEEMPKLSFTFKIGAYIAGLNSPTQQGSVVSGLQRASRNDSASWQQLMNLLALFQGGTYLQDTEQNTRAFPMVGNLAIEYDQMVYVGHMENFTFTDDEGHPHGGIEVGIEFVANKVFDLAPQPGEIGPLRAPSNPEPRDHGGRGFLARTGSGSSLSLFRMPGIGGDSSITTDINRAWVSATQEAPAVAPGTVSGLGGGNSESIVFSRTR
jgi:hypothetical protein